MTATIFDERPCELGEGPLWHPGRGQLFWFDILGHRLLSRDGDRPLSWDFGECVSAAGWIDDTALCVASETALWRFDIGSGDRTRIVPLDADRPDTRSNDGRADPMGGFWIGTMGKRAEPGAGAIWRYHDGRIAQVVAEVTIPNAIAFSGDGRIGYHADTAAQKVYRQALGPDGWPVAAAEVFLDLAAEGLSPDGAVTDAEDHIWIAFWGAGCVARYTPDGAPERRIAVGGRQATCPAFGGPGFETLYVTTAREGLAQPDAAQGRVYSAPAGTRGRAEPRVRV